MSTPVTGPAGQVVPLSAMTDDALRQRAAALAAHLAGTGTARAADTVPTGEVEAIVCADLGCAVADVPPDEPLADLGVSPTGLARLAARLAVVGMPRGWDTSALGAASLTALLSALRAAPTVAEPAIALADVAFTLACGREQMPRRLAVLAGSVPELRDRLTSWLAGAAPAGVFTGPDGDADGTREPSVEPTPGQLAAFWAAGGRVDWDARFAGQPVRRISLPTYPFARRRHWISDLPGAAPRPEPRPHTRPEPRPQAGPARPEPVAARWSADDPVVAQHRVAGRPVLPGVVHLARAYAAVNGASGAHRELRDQVWSRTAEVSGPGLALSVELRPDGDATRVVITGAPQGPAAGAQYSEGTWSRGAATAVRSDVDAVRSDVDTARRACGRHVSAEDFYGALAACGLEYGPLYRGLIDLHVGADLAVCRVSSPRRTDEVLDPTVLDAALQSVAALRFDALLAERRTVLPFALDRFALSGDLPAEGWIITRRHRVAGDDRFDIRVTDLDGLVRAEFGGLRVREQPGRLADRPGDPGRADHPGGPELGCYLQRWRPEPLSGSDGPAVGRSALLLADGELVAATAALHRRYGGALLVRPPAGVAAGTAPDIGDREDVWLVAAPGDDPDRPASAPVITAFAALRALLTAGVLARARRLFVVLGDVHGVRGGAPRHPAAGGLLGLVRSLARELPRLEVRCASVDGDLDEAALLAVAAEPTLRPGRDVAFAGGHRHVRELEPVRLPEPNTPPFRDGGGYLIIGGAGGIGFALARHLCSRYRARVVLTGRRPADDAIRVGLAELAALGGRAEYRAVDVTDGAATARLVEELAGSGLLHGVVHSALVLDDAIAERLSVDRFAAAVRPKVDGAANLFRALAGRELDFVLLMSSTQSFSGAPGQSNYAAGSTGMDALARWGHRALGLPVRVVNWGYWGSVGVVSAPGYAERLRAAGWHSLSVADGLDAVERLLATDLPGLVVARAEPAALAAIGLSAHAGPAQPVWARADVPEVPAAGYRRVERHLAEAAAAAVDGAEPATATAARYVRGLRALARPHLDASAEPGAAGGAAAGAALAAEVPALACRVRLAESCLPALRSWVRGEATAHDVLFPAGRSAEVAEFYRADPFGQRAHAVLADEVERLAAARRDAGRAPLVILEVGAGTGSTTRPVVQRLRAAGHRFTLHVTDASERLLAGVRAELGADGLEYGRLDLASDTDLARLGPVDVIIAGNVLHAVPELDAVLARLRRALRPDGALVLTELVRPSVFHTAVFGVFDAWWPDGGDARRVPHSPLLDAAAWRDGLDAAGFHHVRTTAVGPAGGAPVQAVIVAPADPRSAVGPAPRTESRGAAMNDRPAAGRTAPGGRPAGEDRVTGDRVTEVRVTEVRVTEVVARITAATLGMAPAELAVDAPFASIGVDSLVGVDLVNAISRELDIQLKTIVVFDHSTVRQLARHICAEHQPRLPDRETQQPQDIPEAPAPVERVTADGSSRARAVVFERPGDVRDLTVREVRVPAPGPGQIEIAVMAFPINFSDHLVARGLYPMMPDFPVVPGVEVSGVVRRVGPGVLSPAPGDEVIALTRPEMGGQATTVVVDADFAVAKPASVPHEEACGVPAAHLTMSLAFDTARPRPGETVLITGATGNNGLIGVQLAQALGARVIATAGSPHKVEHLRSLGVYGAVDHRAEDVAARVRELTGGAGADVVVNTLGGDVIQQALRALGPNGRYVETAVFGLQSAGALDLSSFTHNQSFHSLNAKKYFLDHPGERGTYLDRMAADLADGRVRVTTAAVFGQDRVRDAYAAKSDRDLIGRVVVRTENAGAPEPPRPRPDTPRTRAGDIAIVGLSARYAGARNTDELWTLLTSGADVRTPVPDERWDRARYVDADRDRLDTTYCDHGYFVDGIDEFDAEFFGMSGREAAQTDPQQRLFLQEAWRALEVAGITRERAGALRVGVFAGAGPSGYEKRMDATGAVREAQSFWGNDASVLAARISYALDLTGPSVALNTACSSSLVAIHAACRGILDSDCDTALAGGVFLMLDPQYFVVASNGTMLAADGRCKTFSDRADGFGPGEGVGVVVLRRLSDALRDGDHVWGVIRGSAINQDGRTNGITAPSGRAQTAVVRAAQAAADVDPGSIGYLEAHGTGTRLGDPIEVDALTTAFREGTRERGFCPLGSIKTAIGHTAAAAGVAGVIKVCLAFDREEIPASLHCERTNPLIDFDTGPFVVARREPWPAAGRPRRAGVSSFGFSGTNAHLVLEEPPRATAPGDAAAGPWCFAVSAAEPDLLHRRLAELADWLTGPGARYALPDIAATLRHRRDHGPVRCVVGAADRAELVAALRRASAGGVDLPAVTSVNRRAAEAFVTGAVESWPGEPGSGFRCVPVPAAPLRTVRHWFAEDEQWHRHRPGSAPEPAAGPAEDIAAVAAVIDRFLAGQIDEDEALTSLGAEDE
ncbi:SDR family NAD(P)-dependent oxidoreductase [Streptomyces sp. NPDC092296]|uniref:SDR family NAD(P)-dependent oxidoreductase n=1 Tax=Streptomyces sp. NPDC092296 TaxID=3366012 RepID=UPI003810FB3A